MPLRYQLVVQIPGDGVADLDALVALENDLADVLGDSADIDGHDIGSGQGNIFILTDGPAETLGQVRPLLAKRGLLAAARIAYRESLGERYTVLWPERFDGVFQIL